MRFHVSALTVAALATAAPAPESKKPGSDPVVASVKVGSSTYEYNGLFGYGYVPYSAKDSRGDTIGGIGSSATIDPKSGKKTGSTTYTGTFYGLPDRGWNVDGTLNYESRIHKFTVTLDT